MTNELTPTEPVALFDLDGTLADYDAAMTTDLAKIARPEDPTDLENDPEPAWMEERKRLIRNQPGWWRRLRPYAPGFHIFGIVRSMGFNPVVLTKGPSNSTNAWTEKFEWCREHLPGVPVVLTEDKGLVYGMALVDDWPPYGERWLQWRPRGLVVVPAHPWNTMDRFPEALHPNILRYEGTAQDAELKERLATRMLKLTER